MKKVFYILVTLMLISIPSINSPHFSGYFSHLKNMPLRYISDQRIVASEVYPSMNVKLTSSLKPINGYSYGNFGVPTTFYANVFNGTGTYRYHWFVNSTPVDNVTTSSNTSSLTWKFTNPAKFGNGIFDYINVTVTDSSNQSSSASYYGTFYYEPEIFVGVTGSNVLNTPATMNITVTDWLDISPLNLTLFVNGKPIYENLTPGWGANFPINVKYNFTKTGVYNITAVAYDDSGQRIVTSLKIMVGSHKSSEIYHIFNDIIVDFSDGSAIFFVLVILLIADIVIALRRKK